MVDVVLQCLSEHKYIQVKETVREMHYADVAEVFERLEDEESAQKF